MGTPDPDLVYRASAGVGQALRLEVNPVIVTHDAWVSNDRSGFLTAVRDGTLIPLLGTSSSSAVPDPGASDQVRPDHP